MSSNGSRIHDLIDKIRDHPPEKQAVVEDFVDFLRSKDEDFTLRRVVLAMSERAFEQAWGPEDDIDDRL